MKMDLDFETLLEVALGGPEIGPLNLYVLHGLMKQLFDKLEISQKTLSIDEDDVYFSAGYNFIKSKIDEKQKRQRTAGGGYGRERSKVSVIVSDYVRSPIGKAPSTTIPEEQEEVKTPRLLPADVEDRLRYVETQLKTAQNFPSADQLKSWAQEKTSPDTVVTDLWHFVNLNSRMNGAEEGILKLTELVDRLIPELKKLHDEKDRLQGLIDDLYSQMKGLSDRATRLDDRVDHAGQTSLEKVDEIKDKIKEVEEQMKGYAKLMDLEDFLLAETFIDEKNKAREIVNTMQDEIDSKMPMSMLESLKDRGNEEIEKLQNEIHNIQNNIDGFAKKEDIPELSTYVQWPQLEDALLNQTPPSSRASSKRSSRSSSRQGSFTEKSKKTSIEERGSRNGSLVEMNENEKRVSLPSIDSTVEIDETAYQSPQGSRSGSRASNQTGSRSGSPAVVDELACELTYGSKSNSSQSNRRSSPDIQENEKKEKNANQIYPSNACLNKLRELGKLTERQKVIMDELDDIREQLLGKADKSDLDGYLTQDDLQDLLGVLHNMREELSGLQAWRQVVDDEKVPALRDVLNGLEQQVSELLKKLAEVMEDQQRKQDAIDALFACTDRLEDNKLDKTDLPEFPQTHNTEIRKVSRESSRRSSSSKEFERKESTERVYLPPIQTRDMGTMENMPDNNNIRDTGTMENMADNNNIDETDFSLYVTKQELADAIDNLRRTLKDLLDRLDDHESDCRKKISGILDKLDNKMDREELDPLREYLENRYNALLQQQQQEQDEKPTKQGKQTPPNYSDMGPTYRGKSSRASPAYTGYVMDDKECSHPHYGEGGFKPQRKQAALFKKQMKFNCLSCDRPLTMETNSHLQTIRGRPLNAYELDQLRLLQRILKGDNKNRPSRACGGRHTSSTPAPKQRITARMNSSTKSLPAMSRDNVDDILIDGEVDIEGLDGRLYRGLISQKDLYHSRSKSANEQLRTVSPRPISSNGGKSRLDYTSSYGSIEIPVNSY